MLKSVVRMGQVLLCGTCLQVRGLSEDELVPDARISAIPDLAELTLATDQVLVF